MKAAAEYWRHVDSLGGEWLLDDWIDVGTAERQAEFLAVFGPLSYHRGFVELSGSRAPSEIDLFGFHEDLCDLGRPAAELLAGSLRAGLAAEIRAAATPGLRECVSTFVKNGSDIPIILGSPATLHAALWLELAWSAEAESAGCMHCFQPFETGSRRRGRPFQYCEAHRDAKSRQQVHRRRRT